MGKKLTKREVTKHMKMLNPAWVTNKDSTSITRTFLTKNFVDGFMFVTRISVHAEVMRHYPDIRLRYGKVVVTLTTPEITSLSELDFDLAKKLDMIFALSTTKQTKRQSQH